MVQELLKDDAFKAFHDNRGQSNWTVIIER